jgi:hypothetical protein
VTSPAYQFVVALTRRIDRFGSLGGVAFLHFHDAAVLRNEDQWILDAITNGRLLCNSDAIDERGAVHRDQAARQRRLALNGSRSVQIAAVREAQIFDAVARECFGLATYLRMLEQKPDPRYRAPGDLLGTMPPHDPERPECPWNRPETGARMPTGTPCTCSNSTDDALATAFGRKRNGGTL